MSTDEPAVLLEEKNAIAVITLNRPDKHNAINQALLKGLYDALESVSKNPDIRAVVLTGNGKSFCAGVDLKAVLKEPVFAIREDGKEMPELFDLCPVPVIGAVKGYAITGGFEMALCCDFLIASDSAVFIDSHAKLGIHPGWGLTQNLQQAVGIRRARQISFTAAPVPAASALKWGLVNEVVSEDQLLQRAMEIAEQICETNPKTLGKIR